MFLEQFKQVAAADMEVLGDIGDGDIQDGAFVDVVDGPGNVKVVKGVRIPVRGLGLLSEHGKDPIKDTLDVAFVSRSQRGVFHHFKYGLPVGLCVGYGKERGGFGKAAVLQQGWRKCSVKTDPDIGPRV